VTKQHEPHRRFHLPVVEIIGWYGMIAILAAYLLVSFQITAATGAVFQSLNLTGSLGLLAISYRKRVFQNVVLNAIWVAIAIVSLIGLVM